MLTSKIKSWLFIIVTLHALGEIEATSLRLRNILISSGDWLNDADGDNIPGRAGIDYPVYSSVPEETNFRCNSYDYAGYFADVDADCQAYHVCFPDGRNASFLCVNGTVFHQRYYVCDWWFHSNCSLAPDLYDLNIYRKIPLPVLPPVKRKPFPGPAPQPDVVHPPVSPRLHEPKKGYENLKNDRKEKDSYERDRSPNERRDKDPYERRDEDPYERRDRDPYERKDRDPYKRRDRDPYERSDKDQHDRRDKDPYERTHKDRNEGRDKFPYERRDPLERKDRGQQERKDMGPYDRKDRDPRERSDKDQHDRKDKSPYERTDKDRNERRDKDLHERRDRDPYERRDRDPYDRKDRNPHERRDKDHHDRKEKDPNKRRDPYERRDPDPYDRKDRDPYERRDRDQHDRKAKDPNDKKEIYSPLPPNDLGKRMNKRPPTWGRGRDNTCDCRCDSPGSMYAASAVHYDELHEIV